MNRNGIFQVMLLIILGFFGVTGQEIDPQQCKVPIDRIKYKVIFESRSKENGRLFVDIRVKKKNFTTVKMARLGRTLKARYCKEKDIFIVIFDRTDDIVLVGNPEADEWDPYKVTRGYYSVHKDKQIDILEFSQKKGGSTREVVLDLSDYWFADKTSDPEYFETTNLDVKPFIGKFVIYSKLPFYLENRDHDVTKFFRLSGSLPGKTNCLQPLVDKIVSEWVKRHRMSEVIEIYRGEQEEKVKKNFVVVNSVIWVFKGPENLNIELVRKGVCTANSMLIEPTGGLLIKQKIYKGFLHRVLEAEQLAKKEQLGVWKKK